MTTTIDLEVRIEQPEADLDEASDKIRELTEERDELQRRNGELEEKVDSAKDVANELARDLNR